MGGGGDNFIYFVGGHNCYEGGHVAHGGPPARENSGQCKVQHVCSEYICRVFLCKTISLFMR